MSKAIDELRRILTSAGVRVTFDSGCDQTHPCTFCGRSDEPRSLWVIGRYPNGDELERPVCSSCEELVEAHASGPLQVNRESLGRLVREVWIAWAHEQEAPKPSWLLPWEKLGYQDQEVDCRIGDAVAARVLGHVPPVAPKTTEATNAEVSRSRRDEDD